MVEKLDRFGGQRVLKRAWSFKPPATTGVVCPLVPWELGADVDCDGWC